MGGGGCEFYFSPSKGTRFFSTILVKSLMISCSKIFNKYHLIDILLFELLGKDRVLPVRKKIRNCALLPILSKMSMFGGLD